MNDMPTIGPKGGAGDSSERVSTSQAMKALAWIVVLSTVGIPLTILLWRVALSWTP